MGALPTPDSSSPPRRVPGAVPGGMSPDGEDDGAASRYRDDSPVECGTDDGGAAGEEAGSRFLSSSSDDTPSAASDEAGECPGAGASGSSSWRAWSIPQRRSYRFSLSCPGSEDSCVHVYISWTLVTKDESSGAAVRESAIDTSCPPISATACSGGSHTSFEDEWYRSLMAAAGMMTRYTCSCVR